MAADAEIVDIDDESKNIVEKVEKHCAYCKKKLVDYIKCIKCEKYYHKSCTTRVKSIKIISTEIGLCCFDDNVLQNMMFITALVKDNEAKVTEIKLLKTINKEINEKNILLNEKLHNLDISRQTQNEGSYASAVNKKVNIINTKSIQNLPSIIIKPKTSQTMAKTKTDIKKNINPVDLSIGIKTMRETKAGGVIIKCSSKTEAETLRKHAEDKLSRNYEVKEVKLRNPRVKIPGYQKNLKEEEIEKSVKNQNQFIEKDDEFKVTFIKKYKNNQTIFAECSPKLFNKLMLNRKLYIGWERYPIYEDLNILKCYNCQEYNHKGKDCQNKKSCQRCAEEHEKENCNSAIAKCKNCIYANSKYKTKHEVNHETTDLECPSYKYHLSVLKARINYEK